ncbi:MAG: ABC transporter permease [Spirochaetota bacterium]|jgi:lipooligosaccharide transport system permease protein|nr:ABC transporter permease [Spirochaetota bacterium]
MSSELKARYPKMPRRLLAVWYRHYRVYMRTFWTNAFAPFFEPIMFLVAMGFGFSKIMAAESLDGLPFMDFIASGIILMSPLYSASFECTYGTFIRLHYDKAYDGMLAAPLSPRDVLLGEVFWAASKSAFYCAVVLGVVFAFGYIGTMGSLLSPILGFFTGLLFAAAALFVTSFVRYNIDHFNFYFTGFLSMMFFCCGFFFPISRLPMPLSIIAEILPLTHLIRLERALCFGNWGTEHITAAVYCLVFTLVIGWIAIRRLERQLID